MDANGTVIFVFFVVMGEQENGCFRYTSGWGNLFLEKRLQGAIIFGREPVFPLIVL